MRRPAAVVDTGVLVSALAFGGVPQTALKRVFRASEIFVSHDLLAALSEIAWSESWKSLCRVFNSLPAHFLFHALRTNCPGRANDSGTQGRVDRG